MQKHGEGPAGSACSQMCPRWTWQPLEGGSVEVQRWEPTRANAVKRGLLRHASLYSSLHSGACLNPGVSEVRKKLGRVQAKECGRWSSPGMGPE